MRGLGARVAEIEGGVARGVDEDTDAFRCDIERHGGMCIACVHLRVGVDACDFFLAALRERHHLKTEAVDFFAGPERQLNQKAAR